MTTDQTFPAWVTKYALTKGIQEVEARLSEVAPTMILVGDYTRPTYFHGTEWHRDRASAVAKAEDMRRKKIASLKAQIKRLEGLKFE